MSITCLLVCLFMYLRMGLSCRDCSGIKGFSNFDWPAQTRNSGIFHEPMVKVEGRMAQYFHGFLYDEVCSDCISRTRSWRQILDTCAALFLVLPFFNPECGGGGGRSPLIDEFPCHLWLDPAIAHQNRSIITDVVCLAEEMSMSSTFVPFLRGRDDGIGLVGVSAFLCPSDIVVAGSQPGIVHIGARFVPPLSQLAAARTLAQMKLGEMVSVGVVDDPHDRWLTERLLLVWSTPSSRNLLCSLDLNFRPETCVRMLNRGCSIVVLSVLPGGLCRLPSSFTSAHNPQGSRAANTFS